MTWVLSVLVFFQLLTSVKIYLMLLFLYIYRNVSTQEKWKVEIFHPVSYPYTKHCKILQLRNVRKIGTTILGQYRHVYIKSYSNACLLSKLMPKLNLRKTNRK